MSRFARLATIAAFVVIGSLLSTAPSQATAALLGPVLGPLPTYGAEGGAGTPALNSLVSGTCGDGARSGDLEWYTLPSGTQGTVFARARSYSSMYGYITDISTANTAVVDYVTGVVISCTGGPVALSSSRSYAVVAWPASFGVVGPCSSPAEPCDGSSLSVFIGHASGVPANDSLSSATVVPGLPYTGSGNRSLATTDGPDVVSTSCGSSYDKDFANVWYQYTATASGVLPLAADGGTVAVAVATASGPVGQEPFDCRGAVAVSAGRTYLVSVSSRDDIKYCWGDCYAPDRAGLYTLYLGALGSPLATENLTSTQSGAGSVTVTWDAPYTPTGSAALSSFTVSRDGTTATGVGPTTATVSAATHSYTFSNLKAGATYHFTVRAANPHGIGVPAFSTTTLTPDPYPASPAGGVDATVNATASTATLTWQPASPTSSSVPITGYRVARDSTDSGGTGPWSTTVSAAARSFTFAHLRGGSPYRLSVTPITTAGSGPTSSVQTFVLASPAAPGLPTQGTWDYGATANTIVMTWKPPISDGQSPITGYRVSRDGTDLGSSGPFTTTLPAAARSFTLAALNPWYPYTLSVSAINAVGTGPTQSGTAILEADTPGPPSAVTAEPADLSASVSWAAPTQTGASPVTGYRIRRFAGTTKTVLSTVTVGTDIRGYTWNGLSNGTPYSFDVTSINAAGLGGVSLRSNPVTPQPPAPATTGPSQPIIGTATGTVSNGYVRATARWAAPVSNGGSPVLAYRVYAYRVTATGVLLSTIVSPRLGANYRAWTMRLPIVSRYRFTVRAINAIGYSAYSARSNLVVPARLPGAPLIGTAVSGVAGGVITATARWTAPRYTGGTVITAYRVYAYRISRTGKVLAITWSPLIRSALRAYTLRLTAAGNYRFTVRAINAMGYSRYSSRSNLVAGG